MKYLEMRRTYRYPSMKTTSMMSLTLLLILSLMSCEDELGTGNEDVSNLEITVEVPEEGYVVAFTASADLVTSFELYPGESSEEEAMTSTTGEWTYTYETGGSYQIEIRAYNSEGSYISKTEQITLAQEDLEIHEGMKLVWNDEFSGTALNTDNWNYDVGIGPNNDGWGNWHLEYDQAENTTVANGYMTITAKEEEKGGKNYTSSRLTTMGKQEFQYGRVDIRAKLPQGQGIWPALWMLGANYTTVGWPHCGEIDIMEMFGGNSGDHQDNKITGNEFWYQNGPANYKGSYTLSEGIFADDFHVFSIVWTANKITWYMDDISFHVIDTSPSGLGAFREDFFFLINLAVGGTTAGSPDAATVFPQEFIVDYIRMYQEI
ncbi:MAG: glycoside hydrolase family 16 protein [Reichenbachiella sp.]